jgi:hypothetical protein
LTEPVRAEWASGRREQPSTSLLLLFFGGATLLIVGVLAAQGLVGGPKGFPAIWSLAAAIWGTVAVILAFVTRRSAGKPLQIAALIWWFPFWAIAIEAARFGLF